MALVNYTSNSVVSSTASSGADMSIKDVILRFVALDSRDVPRRFIGRHLLRLDRPFVYIRLTNIR